MNYKYFSQGFVNRCQTPLLPCFLLALVIVLGAEDFPRLPLDLNLNVMACFSPMAALVLRRRNRRGSSESGNSGPLWGGIALLSTSVTAGLGKDFGRQQRSHWAPPPGASTCVGKDSSLLPRSGGAPVRWGVTFTVGSVHCHPASADQETALGSRERCTCHLSGAHRSPLPTSHAAVLRCPSWAAGPRALAFLPAAWRGCRKGRRILATRHQIKFDSIP